MFSGGAPGAPPSLTVRRARLAGLLAAAGLAGCLPYPDERVLASTTLVACDGGVLFTVQYHGRDRDRAHVVTDAGGHELDRARTASGTRYTDGVVELREHQGVVALTGAAGGPFTGCRTSAARLHDRGTTPSG